VYGHHVIPLFSGKENPWRESAFSCCDCQRKQLDFAIFFWWQSTELAFRSSYNLSEIRPSRRVFFLPLSDLHDSVICHGKRLIE
jgi:hypothetical protein